MLLAPFYADLLDRPREDGKDPLGPLRVNDILSALHSEQYCDSLAYKTLAVAQCVSAMPNALSGRLGVQSQESLHMQTSIAAFSVQLDPRRVSTLPLSSSSEDREEGEEVPLLGQEAFEPHSGFCDKSLNQIRADFVLRAASPPQVPPSPVVLPAAGRVDERSPAWVLPDGSTNGPVLRALCSKVLAVLSDKPGADLSALHTALVVLSLEHSRALLQLMEHKALVRSRSCGAMALRAATAPVGGGRDLFSFRATVFGPSATASSAHVARTSEEIRCYFARNILCPL